jgi:thiol-disulfide isomerase/thioredoxin
VTEPSQQSPARRARRWIVNVLFAGVWIFFLIRLAPHLAAVVGIETGDRRSPTYSFAALDGGVVASDSLLGNVVLVNFWATRCPPCRVEMPLLQAMLARHRDRGLVEVGLSVDTKPVSAVRGWLQARGVTYPVAVVGDAPLAGFGEIQGYPTSILLDRRGRIRHRALGPLAMVSFEPAVRRLLSEAP